MYYYPETLKKIETKGGIARHFFLAFFNFRHLLQTKHLFTQMVGSLVGWLIYLFISCSSVVCNGKGKKVISFAVDFHYQ